MPAVSYDHVHFFVKSLESLETYKALEKDFNTFVPQITDYEDVEGAAATWTKVSGAPAEPFVSQNRDLVKQLISGLGWRVTASHAGSETESVLVTSPDSAGARFLVTAPTAKGVKRQKVEEAYDHFKVEHLERFFNAHDQRQGCAVLGFKAAPGQCAAIHQRYKEKHAALLVKKDGVVTYKSDDGSLYHVLEVFAYYSPDKPTEADNGTVLRFVEPCGTWKGDVLPGMISHSGTFPLKTEACAFFDHWVSNVVNRKQFLSTLEDTLGFVPKVDFNAGVVAAGEAIIESTVTGNSPDVVMRTPAEALINQEQVYLPINNALSQVGHVAGYIKELGQGIQHLASRVEDLVQFIARTNFMRKTTGRGFCFLNIPQSYYGRLTAEQFKTAGVGEHAKTVMTNLEAENLLSPVGIVTIDITDAQITAAAGGAKEGKTVTNIINVVRGGIYSNLKKLLRDHLTEETYIAIVRNKVLVDIQGNDVLYQIFTAPVLQNNPTDEAPFLEFIQRVCSTQKDAQGKCKPIKPGCGGFGIRNFLTLFLSIEVSKAMQEQETALESGNAAALALAKKKVEAFTDQLDISNPVLTQISDAMTAEGEASDALKSSDLPLAEKLRFQNIRADAATKKEAGNAELQSISDRYKGILMDIRRQQQELS